MMADAMTKRYLKSYMGAAVLMISFEMLVNKIIDKNTLVGKFDLNHIHTMYTTMKDIITSFYGYNKFVMF